MPFCAYDMLKLLAEGIEAAGADSMQWQMFSCKRAVQQTRCQNHNLFLGSKEFAFEVCRHCSAGHDWPCICGAIGGLPPAAQPPSATTALPSSCLQVHATNYVWKPLKVSICANCLARQSLQCCQKRNNVRLQLMQTNYPMEKQHRGCNTQAVACVMSFEHAACSANNLFWQRTAFGYRFILGDCNLGFW